MPQVEYSRYKILVNDFNWSFTLIAEQGGQWCPVIYFQDINSLADFTRKASESLKDMADMVQVLCSGIKMYQQIVTPSGAVWDYVNNVEAIDKLGT